MNQKRCRFFLRWLVPALLLGGCASTPPTKFYLLKPLSQTSRGVSGRSTIAVGVGPVEVPHYLDRPEIVTVAGGNELYLSEFHQWAEPLQDSVTRVLAENLSVLKATDRVAMFPWKRSESLDYQIVVQVNRFDGQFGGESVLEARWRIFGKDGKSELLQKKSAFREPAAGRSVQATVVAMNRSLGALSREIANTVRNLEEARGRSVSRSSQ